MTNIRKLGNMSVKTSANLVKEATMGEQDILKAAQAQASKSGEFEKETANKAMASAICASVVAMIVMVVAELLVYRKIDLGKPALLLIVTCVVELCQGRKLQNKKQVVRGVVEAIVAALFLILYVGAFFRR